MKQELAHSTPTLGQRIRRAILLFVVVPYFSVVLIMACMQRRLIYQPAVADDLSVNLVGRGVDFATDVELTTADGDTLRGWLVNGNRPDSSDDAQLPLVLYFPGNAGNRLDRIFDLQEVASCGFDVLILDYRGFGDSTGSPTERRLSADAQLAWRYACETLGYDERRIVVFGESLGGAVALSLWSSSNPDPPQPAALILNSTFSSMSQVVAWHYPWFPFRFLLLDRWPSVRRIAKVQAPIVAFHGTRDEIVPFSQCRILTNASSRAKLVEVPGGDHNNIPTSRLRDELRKIRALLSEPSTQ